MYNRDCPTIILTTIKDEILQDMEYIEDCVQIWLLRDYDEIYLYILFPKCSIFHFYCMIPHLL